LAERARSTVDRNGLTVGASSNIGIYILPLIVREFQKSDSFKEIPDIQIGNNLETIRKLENSEVDVALMEWWDKRSGFVAKAWGREEVVVIVPPNHPWRRKKRIKKENLFSQALIGGESATGTSRLLQDALGVSASSLKVSLTLGSTEAVKRAVMAGLGISVAMLSSVSKELAAGDLNVVRIEGMQLTKELYVVIPDHLPFSAPARQFSEFLLVRFSRAS
jgi:DNA-binding transcriptional LysR family regulator